jgi:hypothetical protein
LISVFILPSCAIHKKFPFICFRASCVKVAFGVYQLKAWKKNRQGEANARKRRSQAKDSMKQSKKRMLSESDTSALAFSDPGNCDNLKLVFFKKIKVKKYQTDTLILGFRQPENEMSGTDEVMIRNYLLKNGLDHLVKIKLCDCDIHSKYSEIHHSFYLRRAFKTRDYLKEKKVPKKMIELE